MSYPLALVADVYSIVTMILAVLAIAALCYVQFKGKESLHEEDDQRAFFDEHGRWPDEPESAAVRRTGGYGDVDKLPGREN